MITWDQIDTENANKIASLIKPLPDTAKRRVLVATFLKYQGQILAGETTPETARGGPARVSISSYAKHIKIAKSTFQGWLKQVQPLLVS